MSDGRFGRRAGQAIATVAGRENLQRVLGVQGQRDRQRKPSISFALSREQAAPAIDPSIESRLGKRRAGYTDRWLVRDRRQRTQFGYWRRQEPEDPTHGSVGDIEVAGRVERKTLHAIEPSREHVDPPLRV